MIALSLAQIAEFSGGALSAVADASTLVGGPVVVDSRRVEPGALFVAVAGARVDGHDYAQAAIASGAVAVLAARPVGVPAIVVDDPVLALGRLARRYLDRLDAGLHAGLGAGPGVTVVSVTGSSGKTSTKDLLASLLSRLGPTVAPEGSFNTEVGVPLTVLRAEPATRFLVLEKSARGVGHIAYLCGIAPPRIGAVLNVGAAHLGEFGSREVVAQAKGELVEALPADGVAVLNADDRLVAAMRSRTAARVVTFGVATQAGADVWARDVRLDEMARASFRLEARGEHADVSLALHGAHHVSNALAAAAVALELGMPVPEVAAALGGARPASRWRMEVSTTAGGLTVVNDAYNANPESMSAALAALATMGAGGRRRWAVLGEMAELGDASAAAHAQLGAVVASCGIERLIAVGEAAAAIADGAVAAGVSPSGVEKVGDVEAAVALLEAEAKPGDVVLVKASRSADLQLVAERLLAGTEVSA